jgi:hypothetical protein
VADYGQGKGGLAGGTVYAASLGKVKGNLTIAADVRQYRHKVGGVPGGQVALGPWEEDDFLYGLIRYRKKLEKTGKMWPNDKERGVGTW